ncbi:alpha/beta hydrolase [Microbacterium sp. SORGH_AS_0862]|uniref:alpha/beta hydrolase n=1 Tax=Microbacterium sp. SORGH_AS_0862 TaxID=3041789 RepID=UPI00278F38FC|nr:alpha/beta hydrolase [Microbacterium sp. SORGH_AS_0862]MDQ1203887.1 acetyl esterase [Microbacterium sp. SORGH_AS_0862]
MWERTKTDPFVVELDRRLGAGGGRMPTDPVARREHVREADARATALMQIDAPDVASEDHAVPVEGHPAVRVRVFWPWPAVNRDEAVEPLPVLVYFFGGSFTMGGIDWAGWDAVYRARAADARVIVVAGEYALAPEHRFPTQPEQCWAVFEWVHAHAAGLGGDADKIAIGGASAGANLAAAVALMNRNRNNRPVRLQMLEVPVLDLTLRHVDPRAISPFLPQVAVRHSARQIIRDYLGPDPATRYDPYASPLLAPELEGLPQTVIYTAEKDPLRGDGEAYARALLAAGVPTTCVRYLGQTHGSGGYRRNTAAADHLHRDIVASLRAMREPAPTYPRAPSITWAVRS